MAYNAFIAKGGKGLKWAPIFYNTFPHDYKINLNLPVKVLINNTYLELLKEISNCKNRDILIVSHGNNDQGLTSFKFNSSNSVISFRGMFWIILYNKIASVLDRIMTEKNPNIWIEKYSFIKDYYDVQTAEKTYKELLDLNLTTKNKIIKEFEERVKAMNDDINNDEKTKTQYAEMIVDDFFGYILNCLEDIRKEYLRISVGTMSDYIIQLQKIRSIGINNLAIRGCRIGGNEYILKIYCIFFNAAKISAPKVRIYYGNTSIYIRPNQRILRKTMLNTLREARIGKRKQIGTIGYHDLPGFNSQIRSAIYFHPHDGIMENKDEILFLKKGEDGYIVIAEHKDIIANFFLKKFGTLAPEKKMEFLNLRIHGNALKVLPIYCTIEEYPIIFPQDENFIRCLQIYIYRDTSFNCGSPVAPYECDVENIIRRIVNQRECKVQPFRNLSSPTF
jgi:hypothetical protein